MKTGVKVLMVLAIVAIAATASAYALPTLADPLRTRDRDGDCDGNCEQYSHQNRTRSHDCEGSGEGYMHGQGLALRGNG